MVTVGVADNSHVAAEVETVDAKPSNLSADVEQANESCDGNGSEFDGRRASAAGSECNRDGHGEGEGVVVRGGAEDSVSSVNGDCFGEDRRGEGAEADRQVVVDAGDEGGSGPVVGGGSEFGDLFVDGADVARKTVDLGDEGE